MAENVQLIASHKHLSPSSAFSLWKQGTLTNIYNYPLSINEKGRPKDPAELFINSVFNTPDGSDNPDYFQVSPLAEKMGRFMGPSTIGSILNVLTSRDPRSFVLSEDIKKLADTLKEVIEADPDYKERIKAANQLEEKYRAEMEVMSREFLKVLEAKKQSMHDEYSKFNSATNKLKYKLKKLQEEEKKEKREDVCENPEEGAPQLVFGKLEELKNAMEQANRDFLEAKKTLEENEEYKRLSFKVQKESVKDYYLGEFISKLIHSWLSDGTLKGRFSEHFTEQVLVTLAMMNSPDHDKETFLSLYKKIPHVLVHDLPQGEWLNQKYSAADFSSFKQSVSSLASPAEKVHYFLQNPEALILLTYGHQYFDLNSYTVPNIGHKSVHYNHPTLGDVKFVNCMDSSILNFLATIFKDPQNGTLNLDFIRKRLEGKSTVLNHKLEEFLERPLPINSLSTSKTHETWTPLIQGIKGVKYVNDKNEYEVDTDIDNIIKIMDYLLNITPSLSGENGRVEKIGTLCKILSDRNFVLKWSLKGYNTTEKLNSMSTGLVIVFTINDVPAFEWSIMSGHAEIRRIIHDNVQESISDVGTIAVELMKMNHEISPINLASQTLAWLIKPGQLIQVAKMSGVADNTEELLRLQEMLPLLTANDKLNLFKLILDTNDHMDLSPERVLIKIYQSLPDDSDIQKKVFNLILDNSKKYNLEKLLAVFLEKTKALPLQGYVVSEVVRKQNFELLEKMFQRNFSADSKDLYGETFAHLAVRMGSIHLLEMIADKAPQTFHSENNLGYTPVMLAINYNSEALEYIAKKYPETLLKKDSRGNTTLDILLERENDLRKLSGLIRILYKANPEVLNIRRENIDIFNKAILEDLDLLLEIADKNPEIFDIIDRAGTNLHDSIITSKLNVPELFQIFEKKTIKTLTFNSSENTYKGMQVIMNYSQGETQRKLMKKISKAALTLHDSDGGIAHLAIHNSNFKILKFLAESVPEIFRIQEENGNTALLMLLHNYESESESEDIIAIVKDIANKDPESFLLPVGKKIHGNNIAHLASKHGILAFLKVIAESAAAPALKSKNASGQTAVMVGSRYPEIVEYLQTLEK